MKRTLSIGKTLEEEIAFVKQMIEESRADGFNKIADYIWVPELERLENQDKVESGEDEA